MKTLIENGKPSFDTDGKKMYAQFPHIIYHNGKYYLYGSMRSGLRYGFMAHPRKKQNAHLRD